MKKLALKIGFVGTHGAGKSSGATFLAARLKQKYPETSVKVLEENVRAIKRILGGDLNTPTFQKLVIADQLRRELVETSIHEIVICDRTTIDPLVYSELLSTLPPEEYVNLALSNVKTFDIIYFIRPDSYNQSIIDDGFRFTDKKLRNQVDKKFEELLYKHNIAHIELTTQKIFSHNYEKDIL